MLSPTPMLLGALAHAALAGAADTTAPVVGGPPHREVYRIADAAPSPLALEWHGKLAPTADTVAHGADPAAPGTGGDTTRRRVRAVEVGEGYALRLRIHRYASYATLPLFAAQTIAGNQLYQSGSSAPRWARPLHVVGAAGLGTLFGVNTVTGVWNLWDARAAPTGRTRRLLHGTLMLVSEAGFAYAGIRLGPQATRSGEKRREHRRVALLSMSVALAGYGTMLAGDR